MRINDLLARFSLDEKVNLVSDHPRIPRLKLVFSGHGEGLHGLALDGPGSCGAAAAVASLSPPQPTPTKNPTLTWEGTGVPRP